MNMGTTDHEKHGIPDIHKYQKKLYKKRISLQSKVLTCMAFQIVSSKRDFTITKQKKWSSSGGKHPDTKTKKVCKSSPNSNKKLSDLMFIVI